MGARLLAVALLLGALAGPALAQDAERLRAKHAELREQLASSPFQSPVTLDSSESANSVAGEIYAVLRQPFATAAAALDRPAAWCDILFLHLNTKYCRANGRQLDVAVGKKYDQPVEDAYRMTLAFDVPARSRDYLQVAMRAGSGPLSTRDYRINFEAAPLDAARTFIHLSYSYGYGLASKLAAELYLSTVGRGKVGFTVAGTQPDGKPQYVAGMRGVVERNTMRYYLAIDSFLGAQSLPREARIDKSLRDWFAATERFPRQLHEMEQAEYLDMKRREYARQS